MKRQDATLIQKSLDAIISATARQDHHRVIALADLIQTLVESLADDQTDEREYTESNDYHRRKLRDAIKSK